MLRLIILFFCFSLPYFAANIPVFVLKDGTMFYNVDYLYGNGGNITFASSGKDYSFKWKELSIETQEEIDLITSEYIKSLKNPITTPSVQEKSYTPPQKFYKPKTPTAQTTSNPSIIPTLIISNVIVKKVDSFRPYRYFFTIKTLTGYKLPKNLELDIYLLSPNGMKLGHDSFTINQNGEGDGDIVYLNTFTGPSAIHGEDALVKWECRDPNGRIYSGNITSKYEDLTY